MVIIAIPADKVVSVVKETANKDVKGILIISSGFKEAENEMGKLLQSKLSEIAKEYDVKIIGPNTF